MSFADLVPLMPFLAVGLTTVTVMLVAAFYRNHAVVAILTLAGLALGVFSLLLARSAAPRQVTPLLIVDDYALFYIGLVLAATFAVGALSYGYLERLRGPREEFYVLLLTAAFGAMVLVASDHFVSFFLGLETLSVSLYALIAYPRDRALSIEAGIKYLVLAAGSAAILLFGMALIYAELGTMEFARIAALSPGYDVLFLLGAAMVTVGIGFKLAVAPFHMWTPDVYEGAPAPATAFVATVSKGGMFALLLRYFSLVDIHTHASLFAMFTVIAIASMFIGNLLALMQTNVKRILAYSSIAHLGYLLVAFLASGSLAAVAGAYYLAAYFVTTLGAFGVIAVLSGPDRDADRIDEYRGLFWRRPWIAGIFTAMLLSLAGIPFTAGFIGKFYVLDAGEQSGRWLAVFALVINSAIGIFYYLRIVVALYMPATDADSRLASALSRTGVATLAALTVLLFSMGVYPTPIIRLVETFIAHAAVLP